MNTKHISLAISAVSVVALLTGCAKNLMEDLNPSEQLSDLELTHVGAIESKAAIDGTTFPEEGEIGLFLFKDEMATQAYGDGYENIKYTYNYTKEKWTASPSIKVGSTPGYLYGYYPYSSTATDIKAIPVASSLNGDDVMYASTQDVITDMTAANTTITMNHALARVSITVKNNGYTGEAKLSKIKFGGAKTAENGTLNALDGKITATNSNVTLDVPTANQTITATGSTYECLLVPSGEDDNKQTVTLTLSIDGIDKTATLSGDNGVILAQGTQSTITITLSNSGISVQTVSVEDWNVVEIGGYKVTLKYSDDAGIEDDVWIKNIEVIDNTVKVTAYAFSCRHLKCTMPDGNLCNSQSKEFGPPTYNVWGDLTGYKYLRYSFIISDIASNTTATIGYAKAVNNFGVTPSGAGSVEITGESYEGETVTLNAIPAYEYGFDAWLDKDNKPLSFEEEIYPNVRLAPDCISVRFKENLILDGVFTVDANDKKVRFTRGNLYRDEEHNNPVCKVEQHQYDFNANGYTGSTDHVSHFMWCNDIANAASQSYDDSWKVQDTFFTEAADFSVTGFNSSENKCRSLTNEEWQYLFSYGDYDNDARRGKYRCGVTVCGKANCLVLLPDSWTWGSNQDKQEYNYVEWKNMEAAGAVCLPAAGIRNGDSFYSEGIYGYYWTASPEETLAYGFNFYSNSVRAEDHEFRSNAYSVRLVTNVTE